MKKLRLFLMTTLALAMTSCQMFQMFDRNDYKAIRKIYRQAILDNDFPVEKNEILAANEEKIKFKLAAGSFTYSKWQYLQFSKRHYFLFGNNTGPFLNSIILFKIIYIVAFTNNKKSFYDTVLDNNQSSLSKEETSLMVKLVRDKLIKLKTPFSPKDYKVIMHSTPQCAAVSGYDKIFALTWQFNKKRLLNIYFEKKSKNDLKCINFEYKVNVYKEYNKFPEG